MYYVISEATVEAIILQFGIALVYMGILIILVGVISTLIGYGIKKYKRDTWWKKNHAKCMYNTNNLSYQISDNKCQHHRQRPNTQCTNETCTGIPYNIQSRKMKKLIRI